MKTLLALVLLAAPLAAQTPVTLRPGDSVLVTAAKVKPDTVPVTVTRTDSLYCSLSRCPPGVWTKAPPVPSDTTPPLPPVVIGCRGVQASTAQWAAAISGQVGAPGDTICFHAGKLATGLSVIRAPGRFLRCWPNEVCTTGSMEVQQAAGVVGFDVAGAKGLMGINVRTPAKILDNVVRHAGKSGIGFWTEAGGGEVGGNILVANGDSANFDHGIYAQGKGLSHLIRDNIVTQSKAYGIHVYAGATDQWVQNVTLQRNLVYRQQDPTYQDIIVGSLYTVASGVVLTENRTWRVNAGSVTADLGWSWGPKHQTITVRDNLWGGTVGNLGTKWASVTQSGNAALTARVEVWPSPYEPGRANVLVNGRVGPVALDLSAVLRPGQRFRIVRAEDFYGAPVVSATYSGAPVTVTGSGGFDVFVVLGL